MGAVQLNDVVLIAVLLSATVTDLLKGKIYNVVTVPAIIAGLAIAFFTKGGSGLVNNLSGTGIMLAVGLGLLMFHILGGGDAKLLIAVGALQGIQFVGPALLYSALAGGVLALLMLIRQRRLKETLERMAVDAGAKIAVKSAVVMGPDRKSKMPYGLAITAGCIVTLIQMWRNAGA